MIVPKPIELSAFILAEVDRYATSMSLSRNEAIQRLIEIGLAHSEVIPIVRPIKAPA